MKGWRNQGFAAPPAAALHAAPRGAPARGAASACAPCGWLVAAGFPCGGCSLAPRRSKAAPKTGYYGGIIRQPKRNCSLLTAVAIPHALGEGHRALRAPASPSVLCADSQTPGAKSGGCSLLLSRHWPPQPAARAAAFCDDTSGDGGLAHERKLPGLHPRKDVRPIAGNAVDQILAAVAALYPELRRQLLTAA